MSQTTKSEAAQNLYDVPLSRNRRIGNAIVATVGLALSLIVGWSIDGPTLWGLAPVLLYAVLTVAGMDVTLATSVAVLSGLLLLRADPGTAAALLGDSLGSLIAVIGLIIMLGAGLGEILTRTGVAATLVRAIMARVGAASRWRVQLGIMLASAALVFALGTLIAALAIATSVIIPIAARTGFTRSATAVMLFVGGACGLFVAPFAGSMVAIQGLAEVSYPEFLVGAGGPLAVMSFVAGFFVVRWTQRKTEGTGDTYDQHEAAESDEELPAGARRAALVFVLSLFGLVTYSIVTEADTTFAIVAMLVMSVTTALAARMSSAEMLGALYTGCGRLVGLFLLFWLLGALFEVVDQLRPYDVLMAMFGDDLRSMGLLAFCVGVALIGWVGVSGGSAAQVVLIDKVFGSTAAALGVPPVAWSVVLLCTCQGDTFGPFPNVNMIAPMGLARSTSLKNQLYAGWMLMPFASAVYLVELLIFM